MARLDIDSGGEGIYTVRLSRRNLLTLLHKLDLPGSARKSPAPEAALRGVPEGVRARGCTLSERARRLGEVETEPAVSTPLPEAPPDAGEGECRVDERRAE